MLREQKGRWYRKSKSQRSGKTAVRQHLPDRAAVATGEDQDNHHSSPDSGGAQEAPLLAEELLAVCSLEKGEKFSPGL